MFRDVYKWVYEAWHLTLLNWVYKTTSKRTQTWLEPKSDQQYICQMPNYIPHPPTSIPKNTTHKMHWARGYLNAYVLQKNNIDKSHRNSKQGRILYTSMFKYNHSKQQYLSGHKDLSWFWKFYNIYNNIKLIFY